MPDVLAALGRVQLKRLPEMQARRAEIVARYEAGLGDHPGLETPKARAHVSPVWHLYVIRLNLDNLTVDRNEVMRLLAQEDIATSVHYTPIHRHSYYAGKYGLKPEHFPVADSNFHRIISLPLSPAHTDAQIDRVIDVLRSILDKGLK